MKAKRSINVEELKGLLSSKIDPIISKKSKFYDDSWTFVDSEDKNLAHLVPCQITINWNKYKCLPSSIILEVKALIFLFINSGRRKEITACQSGNCLLRYLNKINEHFQASVESTVPIYLLTQLADLDISIIRYGFTIKTYHEDDVGQVRVLLIYMVRSGLSEVIDQRFNLNEKEIRNLEVKYVSSIPRNYDKALPDNLFEFLVLESTCLIFDFWAKVRDTSGAEEFPWFEDVRLAVNGKASYNSLFNDVEDLGTVLEHYKCIQTRNYEFRHDRSLRNRIKKLSGKSVAEIRKDLLVVHSAALYLIFQFTGMRPSEAVYVREEDLVINSLGISVIKGSVKKHRKANRIVNNDYWVAIPIVQLAIRVASRISRLVQHDYIFANSRHHGDGRLGGRGLLERFNKYLYKIDTNRKFSKEGEVFKKSLINENCIISLTRIRHTVASQMIRGNLKIPYISYHFKHLYLSIQALTTISDVTLGYGNIPMEILSKSLNLKKFRSRHIQLLKDSSKIFSRNQSNEKNISNALSSDGSNQIEGLPLIEKNLTDISIGYCLGRNKIKEVNGQFIDPPCARFGGCQAFNCANALFVSEKLGTLKEYYEAKRKQLLDPEFDYMKGQINRLVIEIENVIKRLSNDSGICT